MQITDFVIGPECSILEAMKKIDQNSKGIIYVYDNSVLEGVLTDGDIRRYILKNGNLKMPVKNIANKAPISLLYEKKEKAKELMEQHQISSIPIINDKKQILEIKFYQNNNEDKKKQLGLPVVIMAGGKGARLYPYTQILPKPLIPIGDKTITEHIMARFCEYGCTHFDMIINYKKNFIKSYFLDNENSWDIFFIEEKEYLGTGGGLKLLRERVFSTFFMSNCDILIEEDYSKILEFHQKKGNIVTMVCAMKQVTIPYGTIEISETGQALCLNEKPELSFITNTGLYVIEPEFLDEIPSNTFIHITDVIQKCIDKGKKVGVYPIQEEHWMDMGQLDELERMRNRLKV